MKITEEMVDYVSQLSRLSLPPEERTAMAGQLEQIVSYMDVLNTLDTEGVEPMSHVFPLKNVMRPDLVVPPGTGTSCWPIPPPPTGRPFWSPRLWNRRRLPWIAVN